MISIQKGIFKDTSFPYITKKTTGMINFNMMKPLPLKHLYFDKSAMLPIIQLNINQRYTINIWQISFLLVVLETICG